MLARSMSLCQELICTHESEASSEGRKEIGAEHSQKSQCVQNIRNSELSCQETERQQWKQQSNVIFNPSRCRERQLAGCALRPSLLGVREDYCDHMCHHEESCTGSRTQTLQPDALV